MWTYTDPAMPIRDKARNYTLRWPMKVQLRSKKKEKLLIKKKKKEEREVTSKKMIFLQKYYEN